MNKLKLIMGLVCCGMILVPLGLAQGQVADDPDGGDWLDVVAADSWVVHNGEMPKTKAPPAEAPQWEKPIPVSFRLEYTLATDYVWRGVNWSEYPGEGREDLNHAAGVGVEWDSKVIGVFGASVWFNWFAGSDDLEGRDVGCDPLVQEYTGYWRIPFNEIATTVEFGWSCVNYDAAGGDDPPDPFELEPVPTVGRRRISHTQEIYGRIEFDDSRLWGRQTALLRPYAFYAIEYEATDWGSWFEVGIKPRFVMNDVEALQQIPVIRDLWISPSVSVGVDHRYLGPLLTEDSGETHTRLANIVYGLEVGYDISHALKVPKQYGSVTVVAFLDYSQALRDALINDEFWGGVKVGYSW